LYEPPDLLVSEIFGPTFQGEGRSVGRTCVFVRLGGCNLACSWCDTPYTWAFDKRHAEMHHSGKQYDPKAELTRMSPFSVAREVESLAISKFDLVVISGGEPMLQQEGIRALVKELQTHDFEIETAGTRIVTEHLLDLNIPGVEPLIRYNVSPKLAHSGNPLGKRLVWTALDSLSRQPSIFKFVVDPKTWEQDFAEVHEIMDGLKFVQFPERRVWIMPVGTTAEEQLDNMSFLADKVLAEGWNFTPRLHTLIWGMERGR
jgi:7-carboxy-7-deazaguanine synthase